MVYSDPATRQYVGSPTILVLPGGGLLASHDRFPLDSRLAAPLSSASSAAPAAKSASTVEVWPCSAASVFLSNSSDGATWQPLSTAPGQYWSSPFLLGGAWPAGAFVWPPPRGLGRQSPPSSAALATQKHRPYCHSPLPPLCMSALCPAAGALYLLGTTSSEPGASVSVSRSGDGGATWAQQAAVLAPPRGCSFASGSVPTLLAGSWVYRGVELYCGALRWPQSYQAVVIYASQYSDLLDPASWAATPPAPFRSEWIPAWMPGPVVSGGYLEGNAVEGRDGRVLLLLRCRVYDAAARIYDLQHACLLRLEGSVARRNASLAWRGFVSMPGGGNKFSVKFDEGSGQYLALTNPSVDRYGANADARNILVLAHSPNLIDWRVAATLLRPAPGAPWDASLWGESYQYADWATQGGDLLAVVRTSTDGADSFHNSNRCEACGRAGVESGAGGRGRGKTAPELLPSGPPPAGLLQNNFQALEGL